MLKVILIFIAILYGSQAHAANVAVDVISPDLGSAWAIAPLTDASLLVSTTDGDILHVAGSGEVLAKQHVADMVYDILADDALSSNGRIYFCAVNDGHASLISAIWKSDTQIVKVLAIASLPVACKLAQSTDDLYVAVGTPIGHILKVPKDLSAITEVFSAGHRHSEGLLFLDGKLWEHEHGPRGGDELNLIERGKDYGWPKASDGIAYNGKPYMSHAETGTIPPVFYWTPSIAPSGMAFWDGALWVGALKGRMLVRLTLRDDHVVNQQTFPIEYRVRDIRTAKLNGAEILYVLTDGPHGKLLRIWPGILQ